MIQISNSRNTFLFDIYQMDLNGDIIKYIIENRLGKDIKMILQYLNLLYQPHNLIIKKSPRVLYS